VAVCCTVLENRPITDDVRLLRLQIESGGPFTYLAGHYAGIEIPEVGLRYFDRRAAPADGGPARTLEFHVRAAPGSATGQALVDRIRPVDPLTVHGPMGRAVWRSDDRRPLLLLGGVPDSPRCSAIAQAAAATPAGPRVHLLLGMRTEDDVYFEDRLQAMTGATDRFTYEIALSEPGAADAGRSIGNVDAVLAAAVRAGRPLPAGCQVHRRRSAGDGRQYPGPAASDRGGRDRRPLRCYLRPPPHRLTSNPAHTQ
jgi:NAD(P)H-flavin reductase